MYGQLTSYWHEAPAQDLRITLRGDEPYPCTDLYLQQPDTDHYSTFDCTRTTCTRRSRPLQWGYAAARWDDPSMRTGLVTGGYGQQITISTPAAGNYTLLLVHTSERVDCAEVPVDVVVQYRGEVIQAREHPVVPPGGMVRVGMISVPDGLVGPPCPS